MDESRAPTSPLDCSYGFFCAYCHCKCRFILDKLNHYNSARSLPISFWLKYAIYMATIDYMVASYGPYSASATGGNALARDLLAGIAALYATPRE